jgi:hypothetical protein
MKNFVLALTLLSALFSSSILAVSAKEVGSGGTPVSTVCNPVNKLSYRGDARVGELGFASIDISYGVKSCDGSAVTVKVELIESATNAVFYTYENAPLSAKVTVTGVKQNTSYKALVTVYDATTGAVVGSKWIYAAAVRKTGV